MKKQKAVSIFALVIFMGCMLLITSLKEETDTEVYEKTDILMGTNFQGTIYGGKEDILPDLVMELRNLELETLSAKEESSEIGKLNTTGGQGNYVKISEQLCGYLNDTLNISEQSSGALDPTVGNISGLWDFGGANERLPGQEEIERELSKVGYEKILRKEKAVLLPKEMTIDLGAVGKGIGTDYAADYIRENEDIKGAVIALGGSIAILGSKPDGEIFKLAIVNPRGENGEILGILSLKGDCFISTSGDYEKCFIIDGKRYHHILNPKTGYPAESGLISVTVVCNSGLKSDGLSTACFVLGLDEGMKLLEKYGAEGIFVDEDKNVYVTEGMASLFTLKAKEYKVVE
ncbi:MAG: FAD:protein FMN transferase [Lachnospiraceae bacterium]|nr:FAD:protein FMN transferase [Lachnospiraceae bacterium]